MKHAGIDAIFAEHFLGTEIEPGETWPREGYMPRQSSTYYRGIPTFYSEAVFLFDEDPAANASAILSNMRYLCDHFDLEEKRAMLLAAEPSKEPHKAPQDALSL